MTESLHNHSERGSKGQEPTRWDELKDIPFNNVNQAEDHESEQPLYETELVSPSDVLSDIQEYTIKDGKVYSKETSQEETDENTILRVKTSKLLFNEAKRLRDRESHMLGDRFTDRGPNYYVDRTMDKYGFKNEDTKFAEGKLLKDLTNNGAHHQTILADDLTGSQYDMFVGKKGDLGKALLKRRLKQHGLKMTNLEVTLDSSTFKKDGFSTVDIRVDTTSTSVPENNPDSSYTLHHPATSQLGQLEAELKKAQDDGDEEAAKGYRAALKMVVERNRLNVSPEEWSNMSDNQKERFYIIKMKEEKILGDKEAFNYWNANLQRLKDKSARN